MSALYAFGPFGVSFSHSELFATVTRIRFLPQYGSQTLVANRLWYPRSGVSVCVCVSFGYKEFQQQIEI